MTMEHQKDINIWPVLVQKVVNISQILASKFSWPNLSGIIHVTDGTKVGADGNPKFNFSVNIGTSNNTAYFV